MKLLNILIPVVAALAITGCSSKNSGNESTTSTEDTAATETTVSANNGTVIELEDAATLEPGVKVDRLTVIDFNAVWCGPCRQLTPVLEEMAQKFAGKVDFYSVDVDRFGDLFVAYNVGESIPAVVLLSPDGTRTSYIGTGDLLPADKFEAIINSKLQ